MSEPAPVDPCEGIELREAVAEAREDAEAARRETYELHATSLDHALGCAGDSPDPELARAAARTPASCTSGSPCFTRA